MKIVNKLIFTISVYHTYFENGEFRNLLVKPNDETLQLFKKYNFRIEKYRNRFNIYSGATSNIIDCLKNLISKGVKPCFSFELSNSDPEFYYYTNIPIDFKGTILFGTNSSDNIQEASTIILAPDFSKPDSGKGLAKITIYFDDLLKLLIENQSASYKIKFDTRRTQWVYYIINKNNITLDNPSIQSKNEVSFTGPEPIVTPIGFPAIKFTSGNNLLPYSDTPQLKFDLVDKVARPLAGNNSATKTVPIFKGLPGPDPAKMNISWNEGESKVISPIFIYL